MHGRETERLVTEIRQARTRGAGVAIATIVRVKGSAYRREGTRMLVREDGTYACALSGGCLEPSVADAARAVIRTGGSRIVSYDLADDSLWGLGIGCGGAVDILIERVDDAPVMREWLAALERGDLAALATPLSGTSGRILVRGAGGTVGTIAAGAIEREAVARAHERMRAPFPHAGLEAIGGSDVFFDISTPPPQLVIFGGGHDTAPLAQQAAALDFAVTVVDPRAAYLTPDRFPSATLVHADFGRLAAAAPIPRGAFVLVMSHHLERDRDALRFALESDAAYIGVLGPRSRYQKLLGTLAGDGYVAPAAGLARVRSPVGLSLGAETPDEVALSILGEILAIRRGFEGGFLTGSTGSLHRPDARRALTSS
jgi:xanthine/CO dehydrogenase XdhC/CoxF family maturation factor